MSYFSPIIIEQVTGSSSKMGLILATSSVIGMIVDFSFAQFFNQKKAFFFQRLFFLVVFLFPLSFLLSHSTFSFVMAMAWWGLSYEAMVFCTYHAIHEVVGRVQYAWAWGLVAILKNVSLAVGPLIASATFSESMYLPVYYAIILNAIGVFLFFIYLFFEKNHNNSFFTEPVERPKVEHRSLKETFLIWRSMNKVIWPLLVFLALFYFFDSAVFSVGPLFTEHLKEQSAWGGLFVSLYGIPGIFMGFFINWLSKPFGKKKVAFVSGILTGLTVLLMGFQSVTIILLAMFFTSLWLSILSPEMTAIFEDFVDRGDIVANDLISMVAITGSFSYVVGPILNGFLNDMLGEVRVFQVWGVLIFLCGLWLLLTFPRKTRLPQKEIESIVSSFKS